MKLLSPILHIGGGNLRFEYRAILRKGMHAVYAQWQQRKDGDEYKDEKLVAYEAFRIQSHNGYELAGTWIEPAESMPSASAWGIHGFTYSVNSHAKPLEAAMRRMVLMLQKGVL